MKIGKIDLDEIPPPVPVAWVKGRRIRAVYHVEGDNARVYGTLAAAVHAADSLPPPEPPVAA